MKKNHLMTLPKLCAVALLGATTLLASCAVDGFKDESFVGTYGSTDLITPGVSEITVTPSADKKTQTISWPAVSGAGKYFISLYKGTIEDGDQIVSEVIERGRTVKVNSVTFPREEETDYIFQLSVLDNEPEGNKSDGKTTVYPFSTFTPTFATLEDGTDLKQYFDENPIPSENIGKDVAFDLKPGKTYYLSDMLDFGAQTLTLRCKDKENPAKVIFSGTASSFETSAGLTLKNLNIDCSQSMAAFIAMSKTPAVAPVIVNAWGADYNFYCAKDPIAVLNCKVEGINSFIFWDNKVQVWFPTTLLIDNSILHLTTSLEAKDCISGGYIWTNKGSGFIRSLTINNSTIYNTGAAESKYFVQYGGFGNDQVKDPYTQLGWADNQITYSNCTFYNVCPAGQWGNYNGVAGKKTSYWTMTNCIFWNCSSSGVARRFLAGRQNQETATFLNNTYMKKDGTFDTPNTDTGKYDLSGTDIQEDPKFADPANADFHISGAKQVSLGTGDPRWLPEN